jgi:hypothetical protein
MTRQDVMLGVIVTGRKAALSFGIVNYVKLIAYCLFSSDTAAQFPVNIVSLA